MPLRSPGQLGDARPGCQASGRRMAGRSADIGWSNSLGWYEGFRLLVAVNPTGVITGFGFCAASVTDQQVAETFFAMRHRPNSRLPSVGSAAWGPYVADKGFEGEENHQTLARTLRGAHHPPAQAQLPQTWPKRLRRWLAGIRQIVETVYDKLFNAFGSGGSGPTSWGLASSPGSESGIAQLLYVAQ